MRVFITGITGTLGKAFSDHLQSLGHEVCGIDHNEERVAEMRRTNPDVKIGDFVDADLTKCSVVLHLAALKHIDLCETSPSACVDNNVVKTLNLFRNAHRYGVDILFMSTDKAVEPCSVYGYSKALMEKVALELGGSIARSGNILASNGSVLNIWEKQIQNDEPLTLTHWDMHRYFISPEHLAERVWDLYLKGEKVIIPEMDLDIMLVDLAAETLRKHGKDPDDYPIKFTGLRPGEKLREKLNGDT